jgi:hypothetical protein
VGVAVGALDLDGVESRKKEFLYGEERRHGLTDSISLESHGHDSK